VLDIQYVASDGWLRTLAIVSRLDLNPVLIARAGRGVVVADAQLILT
jgi:hypothetical protein